MRGYNSGVRPINTAPNAVERIICALSYLSGGLVGFIWIIIAYATKAVLKPFVKFHAYQSIFIAVLFFVLDKILEILLFFLKIIPFIGTIVLNIVYYLTQMPIIFGYSLLDGFIGLVIIYLVAMSLLGRFGNIYWISNNTKRMI